MTSQLSVMHLTKNLHLERPFLEFEVVVLGEAYPYPVPYGTAAPRAGARSACSRGGTRGAPTAARRGARCAWTRGERGVGGGSAWRDGAACVEKAWGTKNFSPAFVFKSTTQRKCHAAGRAAPRAAPFCEVSMTEVITDVFISFH